jgi:hypothetical protein
MPKNLNDFAFSTYASFRIRSQLDDNLMALYRSMGSMLWNEDIVCNLFIIRDDETKLLLSEYVLTTCVMPRSSILMTVPSVLSRMFPKIRVP